MEIPVGRLDDGNRLVIAPRDGGRHGLIAGLEALDERVTASLHGELRRVRFEQHADPKRLFNIGVAPLRHMDALTGISCRETILD